MRQSLPPDVAWRKDKEHLGQLFNMAVIGSMCEGVAALADSDQPLGALVDGQKLEAALKAWRERRDAGAFHALHAAALVGWWLQRSPVPG